MLGDVYQKFSQMSHTALAQVMGVRKAFLEISSRISFFKKRRKKERKKNILLGQMTRLQVQDIKDLFLIETFSRQKDKSGKKIN